MKLVSLLKFTTSFSLYSEYHEPSGSWEDLSQSNPAFALGDLEFIYETKNVTVWKKSYFGEEISGSSFSTIPKFGISTRIAQKEICNFKIRYSEMYCLTLGKLVFRGGLKGKIH